MHDISTVKNVPVFVPVFLNAVTMLIFRLKELFQVKNGLTTSLLLFFFENVKTLARSDDAKRRKKRGWPQVNVPIEMERHKELRKFKKHFESFTSIYEIAKSKGLGANPEVSLARINKVVGGGVEAFFICTKDAWSLEFRSRVDESGILQGKYFLQCVLCTISIY